MGGRGGGSGRGGGASTSTNSEYAPGYNIERSRETLVAQVNNNDLQGVMIRSRMFHQRIDELESDIQRLMDGGSDVATIKKYIKTKEEFVKLKNFADYSINLMQQGG